jgi:cell division protein FtsI/penicillin-binding protein 2
MSRRVALSATLAGVLVAGGAGGTVLWKQQSEQDRLDQGARAAAQSFASAWSSRQPDQARYAGSSPTAVEANFATATAALGKAPVKVAVQSVDRTGDRGTAVLGVSWTLQKGVTWSYVDRVQLTRQGEQWAVLIGDGSLWHPKLTANGAFSVQQDPGTRGEVLGRGGKPIMANAKVHDIVLDPVNADASSAKALAGVVGVSESSLVDNLRAAHKAGARGPIPVITYRESDYSSRKSQLGALKGVLALSRTQPLAPTRTFGQPLLGSFGPVTAEMVKKDPTRYRAGGYAGTSGLQGTYDAVMAPTPGFTVTPEGHPDTVLFERKAKDGEPLELTLDAKTQAAAQTALAGTGSVPSALVAVDVRTGNLLAVANSPAFGFDRALTGHYAPGSTLKVATTYSLLSHGLKPTTTVNCPKTTVVNGLEVKNYEDESYGAVPFSTDFAHSCNTAFVALSEGMADADLHEAAGQLGIGGDWAEHLGVPNAYAGSVPVADGETDKAASAFGQGRTLTSPLSLAVMAGSVARGSFVPPTLITSPAVKGARHDATPLDGTVVKQLHALMREVVTDGTAPVLASVPGAPVYAKTGTAEHDSSGKDPTCWIVGWQGDVAFAVLVEKGVDGGTTAGPVAKAFLGNLN